MSSSKDARASLAAKLQVSREEHKIARTKLAKQLRVPVATVEALEDPDNDLSAVSLRGLALKFIKITELDKAEIEPELEQLKPLPQRASRKIEPKAKASTLVASRTVLIIITSVLLLGLLGYALWQGWHLVSAPSLSVATPTEEYSLAEGSSIEVAGSSSVDSTVLVNGSNVSLNADGEFKAVVYLQPGQNIITIEAINALGNKAQLTRYVYNK